MKPSCAALLLLCSSFSVSHAQGFWVCGAGDSEINGHYKPINIEMFQKEEQTSSLREYIMIFDDDIINKPPRGAGVHRQLAFYCHIHTTKPMMPCIQHAVCLHCRSVLLGDLFLRARSVPPSSHPLCTQHDCVERSTSHRMVRGRQCELPGSDCAQRQRQV